MARKSKVKQAKRGSPRIAGVRATAGRDFQRSFQRKMNGQAGQYQGLQVWAPMDPYLGTQRREFKSAMTNPYVYRASRIQTTYVTGQGYTTEIVPRREEDLPDEQLDEWQRTTSYDVPYLNKKMTAEQIKDKIDKMALDLDLASNIFNAYMTH